MRRIAGIMIMAGVSAGMAAAQSPAPQPKAKPSVSDPRPATAPRPPKAWPIYEDLDMHMEMARLKAELAGVEHELAGVDFDLADANMQLKALLPLPPLPPMPEIAAMGELPEKMARMASEYAMLAQAVQPPQPPQPAQGPHVYVSGPGGKGDSRADSYYGRGTQYLDRREWERAVEAFDRVIDGRGTRADGAHYWKAYALNKLGKRSESLATLEALRKSHAGSRWLDDAKALEVELKQAAGRPVSPDSLDDDDIKLIAISGLMNSDPERAVPLLERTLQQSNSPKLKERALFVLANAGTPRAREVVGRIAKGGGNPDLQVKAVEYLGIHRGGDNAPMLQEVYQSTQDTGVKRAVLRAFMTGRQKDRLFAVAKGESNPELRREAVHLLGVSGGHAEIAQLFNSEQDADVRRAMLRGFMAADNFDKLAEIARSEKDAGVRREAIRYLGRMDRSRASEVLVALYGNETDRDIRREVARSLANQDNVKALIEIARKENDIQLKRDIVRMLSNMDTKEARDFLMELLK